MPFKSEAQRRWMFARKPKMAKRWAKHTPKGKKLPEKVTEDKPYSELDRQSARRLKVKMALGAVIPAIGGYKVGSRYWKVHNRFAPVIGATAGALIGAGAVVGPHLKKEKQTRLAARAYARQARREERIRRKIQYIQQRLRSEALNERIAPEPSYAKRLRRRTMVGGALGATAAGVYAGSRAYKLHKILQRTAAGNPASAALRGGYATGGLDPRVAAIGVGGVALTGYLAGKGAGAVYHLLRDRRLARKRKMQEAKYTRKQVKAERKAKLKKAAKILGGIALTGGALAGAGALYSASLRQKAAQKIGAKHFAAKDQAKIAQVISKGFPARPTRKPSVITLPKSSYRIKDDLQLAIYNLLDAQSVDDVVNSLL